jgi:transposase
MELQKMLYHELRHLDMSARSVALLAQRFAGSLGDKAILPFDKDNSKFVCKNGIWFIEVQLGRGRGKRELIPISKTIIPFYDDVQHLSTYPFVMAKEADKWFVYVSMPLKENQINDEVVGIDFNMRRWVASPINGKPLFFNPSEYNEKIDRIGRLISRFQSRKEKVPKELYKQRESIVKLAHGNFLKQLKERYGLCTLTIEEVETMYKLTKKGSKMINNWLYSKTALRRFAVMAMVKGFNVVEVPPKDTSQICHRCGARGVIYGKHKRLFRCDNCELKDFNRDLNSARNIAKLVMESIEKPREEL